MLMLLLLLLLLLHRHHITLPAKQHFRFSMQPEIGNNSGVRLRHPLHHLRGRLPLCVI
jgi:hypothetical protein